MLDNEILEISKTKNDYILDCRWRVPKKNPNDSYFHHRVIRMTHMTHRAIQTFLKKKKGSELDHFV